jgi:hypothetical protein
VCPSEQSAAGTIAYIQVVHPNPRTPSRDTAAMLQEAAGRAVPLLIPGANEPRVRGSESQPPTIRESPPAIEADPHVVHGRGRLEHEREGGGAPSERRGAAPSSWFTRISRRWFHRAG